MEVIKTDIAIVGAGGGGLRSAIAAAEADSDLDIALLSKVYPMRSHTVAAEGGSAAVVQDNDSLDNHFDDTVSGADWLADQDVVDYFVAHANREMTQLEHWGCPWSRKQDGHVNVRRFGGMKIERTWFAADRTGFHMLHTLFQTSMKFPSIRRFDEYFCTDLLVEDGRCQGVVAIEIATGEMRCFLAKAVIVATGGAGRVYRYNTNGGIVTGDGMAMAYRQGVPLQDMEFVQYHPTALPGSGILITEGCRGEGAILSNKDGYRYLQDYGLGPETPLGEARNKYMELGPRDRLSQAFWHEEQKGNTIPTSRGQSVNLDLRHLGEKYIHERLPMICELSETYLGVDPVTSAIPVRPTVHYTMGGIKTDGGCATSLPGLYAIGECASVGLHGANRLGSNSLAELVVFGKVAGSKAAQYALSTDLGPESTLQAQAQDSEHRALNVAGSSDGSESMATIRKAMTDSLESHVGIYRDENGIQTACNELAELKERYLKVKIEDTSKVFNTAWLYALELGSMLDVAEAMAHSALNRRESRGSHQRLDTFTERDDENFLKHTLATHRAEGPPEIAYAPVTITKSAPAARAYGAAGEAQHAKEKEQAHV